MDRVKKFVQRRVPVVVLIIVQFRLLAKNLDVTLGVDERFLLLF